MTPFQEEPESNQTSMMSVSLVNSPFGEPGCVNPAGRRSLASRFHQMMDPFSSKRLATWSVTSLVMIGVPSSA
ncbi:Uncharacterised protein [Chlamydia trachomatis]|nr:Uncharacterised protein [Chlamydia trachomatis]